METAVAANDHTQFAEEFSRAWARVAGPLVEDVDVDTLTKAKEFLTKAVSAIAAKIADDRKKPIKMDLSSCGEMYLDAEDLQFLEPRGRLSAKFYGDRVTLTGKQGSALILGSNISFLASLPSITSSKKEGEDVLIIVLTNPTAFAGKDMTRFLVNLSKSATKLLTTKVGETNIEAVIVPEAFRQVCEVTVDRPNARLFTSSLQQKPFVRCHKGTQEGAIYPLEAGIVFLKPSLFIAVDQIASITAGRGGGAGNTRYVDLKVETADDKVHEFVNIDRDELPALQSYVKNYLEARIRQKTEKVKLIPAHGARVASHEDDEDDSDDEDDDYDPNKSDSDNSGSDDDSDNSDGDSSNPDSNDDRDAHPDMRSSAPKKPSYAATKKRKAVGADLQKTKKPAVVSSQLPAVKSDPEVANIVKEEKPIYSSAFLSIKPDPEVLEVVDMVKLEKREPVEID